MLLEQWRIEMTEYYIRYEPLGTDYYYMIYRKTWFTHTFFERWNKSSSAVARVNQLNKVYV